MIEFHIPDSELTKFERAERAAIEALRKIKQHAAKLRVAIAELEEAYSEKTT